MNKLTKEQVYDAQALQATLIDILNARVGDKATFSVSMSVMSCALTQRQTYDFHVTVFDKATHLLEGEHHYSFLTEETSPDIESTGDRTVKAMNDSLMDFLDREYPR